MIKLYRGDVIEVIAYCGRDKNGNPMFKPRPVVLLHPVNKHTDIISVYCTSKNDGDDGNNIFVEAGSPEGIQMGLTKDTYVRPNSQLNLPKESFKRLLGKCPFMAKIMAIRERYI